MQEQRPDQLPDVLTSDEQEQVGSVIDIIKGLQKLGISEPIFRRALSIAFQPPPTITEEPSAVEVPEDRAETVSPEQFGDVLKNKLLTVQTLEREAARAYFLNASQVALREAGIMVDARPSIQSPAVQVRTQQGGVRFKPPSTFDERLNLEYDENQERLTNPSEALPRALHFVDSVVTAANEAVRRGETWEVIHAHTFKDPAIQGATEQVVNSLLAISPVAAEAGKTFLTNGRHMDPVTYNGHTITIGHPIGIGLNGLNVVIKDNGLEVFNLKFNSEIFPGRETEETVALRMRDEGNSNQFRILRGTEALAQVQDVVSYLST